MKSVNVWVGMALLAAVAGVWIWVKPGEKKLAEVHLVPMSASSGGSEHDVSLADLQGRVVLLNFWGTWCPPCREEFPHIVELYHVSPVPHTNGMLIAFLPKEKVLLQGDFTLPAPGQPPNDHVKALFPILEKLNLNFDRYIPVHTTATPQTKADLWKAMGK